ncbi:branched-chain amino acid aminotransferase [Streptococcus chenjunshii]|uniref:Branched-chain-amino-acid aminotransferase n=1 Tax=Streptococcus chenjunshii TaxID=2173853 RepID=A0A372KQC0_9STRE|nr:branched-chain amino acid aminotransferase [Streptococcus chenjunshii]AXQ78604.1 branched-chain amino acid aminotransferase [Streptococcus chenjunshii]RFU51932.1 branched-chain amino acid aminotransferase [Streptococcus chenjunshii]RFU54124.1 branched-chain amino acid aminotransferase [Streptococcus chenjunshii]
MTVDLDWENLGFAYHKLPLRYISYYKNGLWDDGQLTQDAQLHLSESSPALHYGQQAFEGLKAYRTKTGDIQLFRPDQNAARLQKTADRLLMPQVSTEKFIEACKAVVKANADYVPPYGTGATLYLRPLLIGVGDSISVKPADEYIFTVFAMPVGNYFKGGLTPTNFIVAEDFDRAAPFGTGAAKVGGNYAASLLPGDKAHMAGYSDVIYLDPATHTKIEEVGSANFFGISRDNEFVTPLSPSILPSITKYSLLQLAEERLGLKAVEADVPIADLDRFVEAGACGTAAVISPIGGIQFKDRLHVFYSETEVGPITRQLYDELVGIQFGDIAAPPGWITKVD